MLAIALALGACGSTARGGPAAAPTTTGGSDSSGRGGSAASGGTASCLESDKSPGSIDVQLGAAAYWQADPTRVTSVTIWLREETQAPIAPCPGADTADARCVSRDTALLAR